MNRNKKECITILITIVSLLVCLFSETSRDAIMIILGMSITIVLGLIMEFIMKK